MASYEQLYQQFLQTMPQEVLALQGTAQFGDLFNQWTQDIMDDLGVEGWEAIPVEELANYEYGGGGGESGVGKGPAEQAIFNQITPTLTAQIEGDAARQAEAERLAAQTRAAYGNLQTTLGQTALTFNGAEYFKQNPDVAAAYAENNYGMSVDEFARNHYEQTGKAEGRKPPTMTSPLFEQQVANVDRTVGTIVDASNKNAGIATGALGTMTAEQLANLEKSIGIQQGALSQMTADQIANLETSIAEQRAGLEQQVRDLQGNASAAAASRRAALEQQLATLTAAQQPVSAARLRAAETEIAGINLGLESTRDQLAADAAREGFVGPSSMTEAALARAAIGARQDAARTGGAARVENATDDRGIATYGANQRYSIEDVLAGDTQRAGDYGAGGRAALTASRATGIQGINDRGAEGRASLTAAGATGAQNINDTAAAGRYDITTTAGREEQAAVTAGAGQKSNYFDTLYPNAVSSAQLLTQMPAQQASALTSLIPYGTAGTNNALNTLNWWSTSTTPPTTTAVTTTPSQSGNQLGQLGAGLVGSAFQIGNANNWWQTPSTTTPAATTGTTSRSGKTGLQWGSGGWGNT